MNYTTYKSMIEELDKCNIITTAVKNFIKYQAIKSIDEEIERLESKIDHSNDGVGMGGEPYIDGYNQAIDDQISYLKEQKKLISEE